MKITISNQAAKKLFLRGTLLLCSMSSAQAATILWGNAAETQNYSSDATPLETGSSGEVTFELGIFETPGGASFIPTFENRADWLANWKPFTGGVSDYNSPVSGRGAPGTNENTFTGTVQFSDDGYTAGRQVYVWGFNQKALTDGSGTASQWILFTGDSGGSATSDTNWVIPTNNGQGEPTRTWDVFTATTAVVGMIPDSTGAGTMTDPGPKNPDDSQFATIPEPSTLVFTFLSICTFWRRKR